MYITLVLATWIVIALSATFIIVIGSGIDENTNLEIDDGEKVRPWGLLWLIPLLGILFLFAKTSGSPYLDEIAKTSTEKWPKGTNPDKSSGRITKIEYRSTPFTLKWFGLTVENKSYDETRITVKYNGTNDPSTKQLFSEN